MKAEWSLIRPGKQLHLTDPHGTPEAHWTLMREECPYQSTTMSASWQGFEKGNPSKILNKIQEIQQKPNEDLSGLQMLQ